MLTMWNYSSHRNLNLRLRIIFLLNCQHFCIVIRRNLTLINHWKLYLCLTSIQSFRNGHVGNPKSLRLITMEWSIKFCIFPKATMWQCMRKWERLRKRERQNKIKFDLKWVVEKTKAKVLSTKGSGAKMAKGLGSRVHWRMQIFWHPAKNSNKPLKGRKWKWYNQREPLGICC